MDKFIYHTNTILSFGRHKGHTMKEVIDRHPSYVKWAVLNVDNFTIDKQCEKLLKKSLEQASIQRRSMGYAVPDEFDSEYQFMDFNGNY